ncbi:copper homeostasis protein CutC [Agarivorans litoreus]|uniref:copper homeostasis protein CutC n=1 Tax=Agarivorans litoreus TaxID=1510455 RepID=UPI001C7D564C|nr:copper homeostasis protein CutC [Agarivorans litoreus]
MISSGSFSYTLEICCYSEDDIISAIQGGATRIELCAGQRDGGTTPSYGALLQARQYLPQIDIVVMIRPRGGDFCYSRNELQQMVEDINLVKQLGFNGVVFGALTHQATVDLDACKRLIGASTNLASTFHRAFDCIANPTNAAKQLSELGINRVLSSGQQNKIEQGVDLILTLQQQYQDIEWIVAGGVRARNLSMLKKQGIKHFHSAASEPLISPFDTRYALAMAADKDPQLELQRAQVSQQEVSSMALALERN